MTQKQRQLINWNIKIENIRYVRHEPVNRRIKRQVLDWKKMLKNMLDRGPKSKTYKEYIYKQDPI